MLRSAAARATTTEIADGEQAVRSAVDAVVDRVRRPDPGAPPAPLRAPWGGLGVELVPAGGWRVPRLDDVVVRVTLAHRAVDELTVSGRAFRHGEPATAQRSVITALRRWRRRLDQRVAEVEAQVEAVEQQAEQARATLRDHRFDRGADLAAAEQRLELIRSALEAGVDDLEPERDGAA